MDSPSTTSRRWADKRQVAGLLLVLVVLLSGRVLHSRLLVGSDGRWREHLWLDAVVAAEEPAARATARPQLTTPLPINSCGADSLLLLPGVGPVLAARIDEARRGGLIFRNDSDLQTVKGIGPRLAAKLDTLLDYGSRARRDTTLQSPH